MAVGNIEFYRMPGALSTGEYPILDAVPHLQDYLVHTEYDAKYVRDIVQAIGPFPTFIGYDNVNLVKIDDEWYWITSWKTNSLQLETVTYGIVYNAPTSLLRMGQTLDGIWKRTPTQTRDYMTATISSDAMKASRSINIPSMNDNPLMERSDIIKYFWCEIAGMKGEGSDKQLVHYGFLIAKNKSTGETVDLWAFVGTNYYKYPTIETLFNASTVLGIYADEIIQISISERCPYNSAATYHSPSSRYLAKLVNREGTAEDPPGHIGNNAYYDMTDVNLNDDKLDPASITLTLSTNERMFGSTRIINESGTAIGTIPHQYGSTITITAQTINDITGIYTMLSIGDRLITTINEGHLPWTGSAWTEYQGRQMDSDRQMTEFANQQVNADLGISLAQSQQNQNFRQIDLVMNAAASASIFNPAGAIVGAIGAGIGVWQAAERGDIERKAYTNKANYEIMGNELKQSLNEKTMQNAAGTAYSMGYGLIYIANTVNHPAKIQLEMPANITDQYISQYMAEFGWPSEGRLMIEVEPGFIQGKIISSVDMQGVKFEELITTIGKGFKIRSV